MRVAFNNAGLAYGTCHALCSNHTRFAKIFVSQSMAFTAVFFAAICSCGTAMELYRSYTTRPDHIRHIQTTYDPDACRKKRALFVYSVVPRCQAGHTTGLDLQDALRATGFVQRAFVLKHGISIRAGVQRTFTPRVVGCQRFFLRIKLCRWASFDSTIEPLRRSCGGQLPRYVLRLQCTNSAVDQFGHPTRQDAIAQTFRYRAAKFRLSTSYMALPGFVPGCCQSSAFRQDGLSQMLRQQSIGVFANWRRIMYISTRLPDHVSGATALPN